MPRPPLWQKGPNGTLDATATFKVLCVYLTMGVFLFVGLGALASLAYQWTHEGKSLDPSESWRAVLNSIFFFLGAAFGIAYAAGVGKDAVAPKAAAADAIRAGAPPSVTTTTTTTKATGPVVPPKLTPEPPPTVRDD